MASESRCARWSKVHSIHSTSRLSHGLGGHALCDKGLHDIAGLDVVVVGDGQAALKTALDLAGVVLEPLERIDLAGMHHHVVAQQADLAVPFDEAILHHASGDISNLGDAEHFANLRPSLVYLLECGLQHTG